MTATPSRLKPFPQFDEPPKWECYLAVHVSVLVHPTSLRSKQSPRQTMLTDVARKCALNHSPDIRYTPLRLWTLSHEQMCPRLSHVECASHLSAPRRVAQGQAHGPRSCSTDHDQTFLRFWTTSKPARAVPTCRCSTLVSYTEVFTLQLCQGVALHKSGMGPRVRSTWSSRSRMSMVSARECVSTMFVAATLPTSLPDLESQNFATVLVVRHTHRPAMKCTAMQVLPLCGSCTQTIKLWLNKTTCNPTPLVLTTVCVLSGIFNSMFCKNMNQKRKWTGSGHFTRKKEEEEEEPPTRKRKTATHRDAQKKKKKTQNPKLPRPDSSGETTK